MISTVNRIMQEDFNTKINNLNSKIKVHRGYRVDRSMIQLKDYIIQVVKEFNY